MITIAVVEDQEMVRQGLVAALAAEPDLDVVYEGSSPESVAALRPLPRIVLLDLDLNGVPCDPARVRELTAQPGGDVIVVSALQQADLGRAMLDAGAATICPKHEPIAALMQAVRAIAAGESWTSPLVAHLLLTDPRPQRPELSAQELRVLRGYASGMPLAAVAAQLFITPDTAGDDDSLQAWESAREMADFANNVIAVTGRAGYRYIAWAQDDESEFDPTADSFTGDYAQLVVRAEQSWAEALAIATAALTKHCALGNEVQWSPNVAQDLGAGEFVQMDITTPQITSGSIYFVTEKRGEILIDEGVNEFGLQQTFRMVRVA